MSRQIPSQGAVTAVGGAACAWRDKMGLLVVLGAVVENPTGKTAEKLKELIPKISDRNDEMARLLEFLMEGNTNAAWRLTKSEIGYSRERGAKKGLLDTILDSFGGPVSD